MPRERIKAQVRCFWCDRCIEPGDASLPAEHAVCDECQVRALPDISHRVGGRKTWWGSAMWWLWGVSRRMHGSVSDKWLRNQARRDSQFK